MITMMSRLGGLLALSLLASSPATAQARTWLKQSYVVTFDEEQLACTEFTFISTGETIVFDVPDGHMVTFRRVGGPSIAFADSDRTIAAVRARAATVMDGASTPFKYALRNLAEIGSIHGVDLLTPALILTDVLYPVFADSVAIPAERNTGSVVDFDPATTPPNAFEQQFGANYFE
jgi:hypothetical protein